MKVFLGRGPNSSLVNFLAVSKWISNKIICPKKRSVKNRLVGQYYDIGGSRVHSLRIKFWLLAKSLVAPFLDILRPPPPHLSMSMVIHVEKSSISAFITNGIGSKGALGTCAPDQIYFIFMQFSSKSLPNIRLGLLLWEILDPPLWSLPVARVAFCCPYFFDFVVDIEKCKTVNFYSLN